MLLCESVVLHLERDLDRYGWIMSTVQDQKVPWICAVMRDGALMTVDLMKTPELCASNVRYTVKFYCL